MLAAFSIWVTSSLVSIYSFFFLIEYGFHFIVVLSCILHIVIKTGFCLFL